jgi:DNA-binding PadR family transcriptional regulator
MMPGRELNATAASLLGFLHEGPKTGWELAATAQRVIGDFWSLTQSQIYRELAAMAAAGLIEAGERGPRHRQPYTLTPAGRAAFAAWIQREPGDETIRYPLLLALAFGRFLPPERIAGFVARHRAVHAARLQRYEQAEAAIRAGGVPAGDPFVLATLSFGLHYERAVLAWFDELPESIRGGDSSDGAGLSDA